MVAHSAHHHTERGGALEASDDLRAGMQRDGSDPVRAHDVPRHRHVIAP